jgi:hypothetical protein
MTARTSSQSWLDVTYLDFSGRCQAVGTTNAGKRSWEIDNGDDSNGGPLNAWLVHSRLAAGESSRGG